MLHPISRRQAFSWIAALASGVHSASAWTLKTFNDQEYVSLQDIKTFYRFPSLKRSGRSAILSSRSSSSQGIIFRCSANSSEIYFNNVKFLLSFPTVEAGGQIYISRMDLSKLIDPIIRPSHISVAQLFDTVVLDPGHGGHDYGARGVLGYEKTYALDTANRLAALLRQRGLKVVMTRTGDTYPSLGERVAIANNTPNSIFISIHFNWVNTGTAQGVETYSLAPQGTSRSRKEDSEADDLRFRGNTRDSENIALATAVHGQMLYRMKPKPVDRGIMRDRWFVLKGLERPGILVEGGFVNHPVEGRLLHEANYRQQLAYAIGCGIVFYRKALTSGRGAKNQPQEPIKPEPAPQGPTTKTNAKPASKASAKTDLKAPPSTNKPVSTPDPNMTPPSPPTLDDIPPTVETPPTVELVGPPAPPSPDPLPSHTPETIEIVGPPAPPKTSPPKITPKTPTKSAVIKKKSASPAIKKKK